MVTQALFSNDNDKVGFIRLLDSGESLGNLKPQPSERVLVVGMRDFSGSKIPLAIQQAMNAISSDRSFVMGGTSSGGESLTDDKSVVKILACTVSNSPAHLRDFVAFLQRGGLISDLEKRETLIDLRIHTATERFRTRHEQLLEHGAGI